MATTGTFMSQPVSQAAPTQGDQHSSHLFGCSSGSLFPHQQPRFSGDLPLSNPILINFERIHSFSFPCDTLVCHGGVCSLHNSDRVRFLPSRHRKWDRAAGCCCRDKMAPGNRLGAGAWGRPGSAPVQNPGCSSGFRFHGTRHRPILVRNCSS